MRHDHDPRIAKPRFESPQSKALVFMEGTLAAAPPHRCDCETTSEERRADLGSRAGTPRLQNRLGDLRRHCLPPGFYRVPMCIPADPCPALPCPSPPTSCLSPPFRSHRVSFLPFNCLKQNLRPYIFKKSVVLNGFQPQKALLENLGKFKHHVSEKGISLRGFQKLYSSIAYNLFEPLIDCLRQVF